MSSGEYLRYVALGDSQTEGLGDGDDITGLRGWADRLAEHLAVAAPVSSTPIWPYADASSRTWSIGPGARWSRHC
jgi:hypothetical protein